MNREKDKGGEERRWGDSGRKADAVDGGKGIGKGLARLYIPTAPRRCRRAEHGLATSRKTAQPASLCRGSSG